MVWTLEIQFPTVYNNQFADVIVGPLGILGTLDQAHVVER